MLFSALLEPGFLVVQCLHQDMRGVKDLCVVDVFDPVYLCNEFRDAEFELLVIFFFFVILAKDTLEQLL